MSIKKSNNNNINAILNSYFNIGKNYISSSTNEKAHQDVHEDIQTDSIKINGHQTLLQHSHQTYSA